MNRFRRAAIVLAVIAAMLTTGVAVPAAASSPPGQSRTAIGGIPSIPASTYWGSHIQNLGNRSDARSIDLVNEGHVMRFFLGTEGRSLRLEQVYASPIEVQDPYRPISCDITLQGHVQNIGWQAKGRSAGTTGKGLRLEAIRMWSSCKGVSISYAVHVQNRGWMRAVSSGQTAGTIGQGLRIEAISITINLPDFSGIRDQYLSADQRLCRFAGTC